jgi:hypothetical protein
VRWVVVSGSALRHLRSTGTLHPCSAAPERRAPQNGVEHDGVAVQHIVLQVLHGPSGGHTSINRSQGRIPSSGILWDRAAVVNTQIAIPRLPIGRTSSRPRQPWGPDTGAGLAR